MLIDRYGDFYDSEIEEPKPKLVYDLKNRFIKIHESGSFASIIIRKLDA